MKIGFIGCVQSSQMALNKLVEMKSIGVDLVAVITKKESTFNADYVDLAPICKEYDIPVHFEDAQNKDQSVKFMKIHEPDIIFCFGWSYLLNDDFLTLPEQGVIGFHPAKLPKNRGRHPIIWALALGLKETASTFFKMDEGADTGPILSQVDIDIDYTDDANTLYKKIMSTAQQQIAEFTEQLLKGTAEFKPQDNSKATNWRKRSRKDGLIDWRMPAEDIYNLIRALTTPYPGAEFKYKENYLQVWKSRVCSEMFPDNIEPGYILTIDCNGILVKCAGHSAVWLLDVKLDNIKVGDYL
jgi:methionyl-tRNA formyltransferase